MEFESRLIPGTLLRRYKRFLADVRLEDGREVTAHCANTGAMTGLKAPGMRVWLRDSANHRRKYPLTWELVEPAPGTMACINTARTNALVLEALEARSIPALAAYSEIACEVRAGAENSRLDFRLSGDGASCFMEVKHVTLADHRGMAMFPDAVTRRGQRHLRELAGLAGAGHRAVLFLVVARTDTEGFRPADEVDPDYGRELRAAVAAGVEVMAWQLAIDTRGMNLVQPVAVDL